MDCIQIWCVSSRIHYIITLDKCGTHVWGGVHLHVRTCTPRFPDLANGWADCVQILCVNRDPLDNCFAHIWCGLHLHVRTCTPRFPYLANGRSNCVKIWWMARDPWWACFTHVGGGGASVRVHVQIPFQYRQHEQPTFGPQRYPESAASQVTEGWLNMETTTIR